VSENKQIPWLIRRIIIPVAAAFFTGVIARGYLEHHLPPGLAEALLHPIVEPIVSWGAVVIALA